MKKPAKLILLAQVLHQLLQDENTNNLIRADKKSAQKNETHQEGYLKNGFTSIPSLTRTMP